MNSNNQNKNNNNGSTHDTVSRYFASWRKKDRAATRALLADDVTATTPINSYDTAEPFVDRLMAMGAMINETKRVHFVVDGDVAAVLDDVSFAAPVGSVRTAWFFRVVDGKIRAVDMAYDATELRNLGKR